MKARTRHRARIVKIKSVVDSYPNMAVWPRGGNCQAYGHPLDDGGHILITTVGHPSLPEPDDKYVCIGMYDRNSDEVKLIERCAVKHLAKTIDGMIAKGSSKGRSRGAH